MCWAPLSGAFLVEASPARVPRYHGAPMARQQRTQQGGPGRGRRRGLSDRGRPRKYTRINSEAVDYKDLNLLRRFLSDKGKTRGRRVTGLSRKHQRQLSVAASAQATR